MEHIYSLYYTDHLSSRIVVFSEYPSDTKKNLSLKSHKTYLDLHHIFELLMEIWMKSPFWDVALSNLQQQHIYVGLLNGHYLVNSKEVSVPAVIPLKVCYTLKFTIWEKIKNDPMILHRTATQGKLNLNHFPVVLNIKFGYLYLIRRTQNKSVLYFLILYFNKWEILPLYRIITSVEYNVRNLLLFFKLHIYIFHR